MTNCGWHNKDGSRYFWPESLLVVSKLSEIFVNFLEAFLDSSGLMADGFQKRLCYKLRSCHTVEKGVAVYRGSQKNGGVFRQKGAGLIGYNDDLASASRAI